MIYYAIRHKASGEFMPQLARGRGYSHWNPSNLNGGIKAAKLTGAPRLFYSIKKANLTIIAWNSMPNGRYAGYVTSSGEDDYDLDFKPDGRKREDLEVVRFNLIEEELS